MEWGLLLAALGAFTVTETYRSYVGWGLGLLAASFLVRCVRTGRLFPRTGLEVPWALFVVSGYLGLLAAYDRPQALLLLARILAAWVLYYALVESGERVQRWVAVGLVLMAVGLALYWPTQHDFTAIPGKLAAITQFGAWINTHVPRLPGPSIHNNVAGGTLSLAIPLAAALAYRCWQRRWRVMAAICVGGTFVLAVGLFLTSNRAGWLGVAAALGLGALAWTQRRWLPGGRGMACFWGAAAALAGVAVAAVVGSGNLGRLLGMIPDPTGALQGRPRLWGQGLTLARDYAFTGCGLGAFSMVYSTYGILIHTPFLTHIHNTYLEVWIEQGVLGALALVWGGAVVLTWCWRALRSRDVHPLGWAGLAALMVVAVHGVFDAAFYGTRTLPLLGLVLGYAWFAVRRAEPTSHKSSPAIRRVLVLVAAGALVVVAVVFHRSLLSAWHANWGALAQTRVELGIYDPIHFDKPSMDQIRQTADLSPAEQAFGRALDWDEDNLTVRQRLGAISLSRGKYEEALIQLQAAWDGGQRDEVTRLLLGDALLATGQVEGAVETVRGLTWAETRIMGHAWYRYWVNGDYRRAADAWRAALLLNPENKEAARWQKEAEKRLGE